MLISDCMVKLVEKHEEEVLGAMDPCSRLNLIQTYVDLHRQFKLQFANIYEHKPSR